MKSIIKSLVIISLAFFSCEKEKTEPKENEQQINTNIIDPIYNSNNYDYSKIKFTNGILEFESIEYYESIVNHDDYSRVAGLIAFIGESEFESFNKVNPSDTTIDEEFMESILNAEKIVKIGEWFIKINVEREMLTALSSKNMDSYSSFENGEFGGDILLFSTEDDVIDHLKDGTLPTDRKGCADTAASPDNRGAFWINYCTNYKVKLKSAYYSLGVYKKLRIEFWHKQISGSSNNTPFSLGYQYLWKKKCKNVEQNVLHIPVIYEYYGSDHKMIPFYSSTRSLTKYYISATAHYRSACSGVTKHYTLSVLNHGY